MKLLVVQKDKPVSSAYSTSQERRSFFRLLETYGIQGRHSTVSHVKEYQQQLSKDHILRYRTKQSPLLSVPAINTPEFLAFTNDKRTTYLAFSSFCPQTFLTPVPMGIHSGKWLVKPRFGKKGAGICTLSQVTDENILRTNGRFIIQEYKEFHGRIGSLTRSHHDIRCLCVGTTSVGGFQRVRQKHAWKLSKTSRQYIPDKELDAKIHDFLQTIILLVKDKFGTKTGIRSIDFGIVKQVPLLIEINGAPGISSFLFLQNHKPELISQFLESIHRASYDTAPYRNPGVSGTSFSL